MIISDAISRILRKCGYKGGAVGHPWYIAAGTATAQNQTVIDALNDADAEAREWFSQHAPWRISSLASQTFTDTEALITLSDFGFMILVLDANNRRIDVHGAEFIPAIEQAFVQFSGIITGEISPYKLILTRKGYAKLMPGGASELCSCYYVKQGGAYTATTDTLEGDRRYQTALLDKAASILLGDIGRTPESQSAERRAMQAWANMATMKIAGRVDAEVQVETAPF